MPVDDDASRLPAEHRARALIDSQPTAAGWAVHDRKGLNLFAADGAAVPEVVMAPGHGRVAYLLYVDERVIGVIEAKPEWSTLSGVEWQSAMYATGLAASHRARAVTVNGRMSFVFEASGTETHLTNGYDPEPRARRIFAFPQPSTPARIVRTAAGDPDHPTWRSKVRHLPVLNTTGLRPAQIDAIGGVERSLVEQRFSRSLIQMATGAGKSYTVVTQSYRLLKHSGFTRILLLVDRNNLADQALAEFGNYRTPDDGRRFTELYAVDKLSSAGMLASSNVVVSTIQRVHRVLSGHDSHHGPQDRQRQLSDARARLADGQRPRQPPTPRDPPDRRRARPGDLGAQSARRARLGGRQGLPPRDAVACPWRHAGRPGFP